MTARHTPGPWYPVEAESMKYCSVVEYEYGNGARGTVGLVGTDGITVGASDLERQNADTHLIAAAPTMLAALEAVDHLQVIRDSLTTWGFGDSVPATRLDEIIAAHRAAIAKATSE